MVNIVRRALKDDEISLLVEDIKKYTALIRISEKNWKSYRELFVAEINGKFAGTCAFFVSGEWVKLGPMVVLEGYQGQGIGRAIIQEICKEKWNIYIGSSNPKLQKLLLDLGFERVNASKVPLSIYFHHLKSFYKYTDDKYFKELIRKLPARKKETYMFFIRRKNEM